MSNYLAVFDVDGTLFHSFLLEEVIEELAAREIFSKDAPQEYARQRKNWITTHTDYRTYVDTVLKTFQKHIKGVTYSDFNEVAEAVVERNRNHIFSYTRQLITDLSRNDYFLLAVSHSPKGVVDKFCQEFGFDKVYGVFYELGPSDRFTGEITDEHVISNKSNIIRRVAQQENIPLEQSFGIGDSEDDIPFLEMMDRPICFNPTRELYRHGKLNHWQVVVEQKGVIYELPMQ